MQLVECDRCGVLVRDGSEWVALQLVGYGKGGEDGGDFEAVVHDLCVDCAEKVAAGVRSWLGLRESEESAEDEISSEQPEPESGPDAADVAETVPDSEISPDKTVTVDASPKPGEAGFDNFAYRPENPAASELPELTEAERAEMKAKAAAQAKFLADASKL